MLYPNINHTHKVFAAYFITYFFLCATLMTNVITGAIIDAYSAALSVARSQEEQDASDRQEAVLMAQARMRGRGGATGPPPGRRRCCWCWRKPASNAEPRAFVANPSECKRAGPMCQLCTASAIAAVLVDNFNCGVSSPRARRYPAHRGRSRIQVSGRGGSWACARLHTRGDGQPVRLHSRNVPRCRPFFGLCLSTCHDCVCVPTATRHCPSTCYPCAVACPLSPGKSSRTYAWRCQALRHSWCRRQQRSSGSVDSRGIASVRLHPPCSHALVQHWRHLVRTSRNACGRHRLTVVLLAGGSLCFRPQDAHQLARRHPSQCAPSLRHATRTCMRALPEAPLLNSSVLACGLVCCGGGSSSTRLETRVRRWAWPASGMHPAAGPGRTRGPASRAVQGQRPPAPAVAVGAVWRRLRRLARQSEALAQDCPSRCARGVHPAASWPPW